MSEEHKSDPRLYSRRDVLAMGVAFGAAGALPAWAQAPAAKPLLVRKIPRTGEPLAVVGLGTAIVFDIGNDAARRAERSAVIRNLLDGGARLIDTAPSYGTAEPVVGDLLAEMKVRDSVFVATKTRVASRDRSAAEMQRSQKQLRTEKIDLMQIHNVGFADRAEVTAQLALLREWKGRGLFRYVGVTHSQDQENANERLIEIMRTEKLDFMQINYFSPSAASSGGCLRSPPRPEPRYW